MLKRSTDQKNAEDKQHRYEYHTKGLWSDDTSPGSIKIGQLKRTVMYGGVFIQLHKNCKFASGTLSVVMSCTLHYITLLLVTGLTLQLDDAVQ